ncbi:uncharacterized protein LOC144433866 [Glandiceps talaboti]
MYKGTVFVLAVCLVACAARHLNNHKMLSRHNTKIKAPQVTSRMCLSCKIDRGNVQQRMACREQEVACPSHLKKAARKLHLKNIDENDHQIYAVRKGKSHRMYSAVYDADCNNSTAGDDLDPEIKTCLSCARSYLNKWNGYSVLKCLELGKDGCPMAFARGCFDFEIDKENVTASYNASNDDGEGDDIIAILNATALDAGTDNITFFDYVNGTAILDDVDPVNETIFDVIGNVTIYDEVDAGTDNITFFDYVNGTALLDDVDPVNETIFDVIGNVTIIDEVDAVNGIDEVCYTTVLDNGFRLFTCSENRNDDTGDGTEDDTGDGTEDDTGDGTGDD